MVGASPARAMPGETPAPLHKERRRRGGLQRFPKETPQG